MAANEPAKAPPLYEGGARIVNRQAERRGAALVVAG